MLAEHNEHTSTSAAPGRTALRPFPRAALEDDIATEISHKKEL